MKILQLGDQLLREKALPVEKVSEEIDILIENMCVAMDEQKGVGLAAPQIGILLRVFVARVDDGVLHVFINPQIIGTSQETEWYEEGCLSLPKVYQKVLRPSRVKVQARNRSGKLFTVEAEGLLARVIQHENDHLDGVLFIDKCDATFKQKIELQFAKQALKDATKRKAKQADKGLVS